MKDTCFRFIAADKDFSVYSLFSALIMHVYQMRSSNQAIVEQTQERLRICMDALKEVSKVWLVAKMVHTLFESILGNKVLEERLQKAAGKLHMKVRTSDQGNQVAEQQKRRYEDMELGYTTSAPAPQLSYERSRPQTPAVTPSRELSQQSGTNAMPAPSTVSPVMRQTDAYLSTGSSRNNTRPPTPFNPLFHIPATPSDLYLVTRNSPPISQNLWENFQPDQLFPDGMNMGFSQPFSMNNQQNLDPQLQMPQMSTPTMQHSQMQGQQLPLRTMRGSIDSQMQGVPGMGQQQNGPPIWSDQFSADSPEDNWSNSSRAGSSLHVPATLNVEDW